MKRILMAAAIATAFTASPTMAATFSSASLSNYKVSLVDLDLEDGITPSIYFYPTVSSEIRIATDSSDPLKLLSIKGDNISPTSVTVTKAAYTASASIFGDNIDHKVLQVSGNSLEGGVSNDYTYYSHIDDTVFFTLSAKTQLTITADALFYAETTADMAAYERASTYAILAFGGGVNFDADPGSLSSLGVGIYRASNLSELMLLSVMTQSGYGYEYTGSFYSSVVLDGISHAEYPGPSAVPVPAALPLMASALGLFGLGAKRRKALKT